MELPQDARQVWITGDPAPGSRREAKHHLVTETKRLIDRIVLLDVDDERTNVDELARLIAMVRTAADGLERMPNLADKGGPALSGGDDARLSERSGITGRANPIAPPLHIEFDGAVARAWATYDAAYEGPPNCLHGGFVAAAFDDLLGVAQMTSGAAGFTGTLTVKMRKPTPLYRRIDYEAGVSRVDGRKIWVWGRSYDGETLLAEAEILFISPKGGLEAILDGEAPAG
jgi:acyl-coenzyme A thioesterase PaaI-like protein